MEDGLTGMRCKRGHERRRLDRTVFAVRWLTAATPDQLEPIGLSTLAQT